MRHINRLTFFEQKFDKDCIGAELGVASGHFSNQLLHACKNLTLYSIDAWAGDRGHNDAQYESVKTLLSKYENRSIVIKSKFADIVNNFADNYFDFIYIDGYAHTGQNRGQTFIDWYPKVKIGGIISGHDYDEAWPRTIEAVDSFIEQYKLQLYVIYDEPYSSWYAVKK